MPSKSTISRCVSCGEFIRIDADRCRFCSAPVDREGAATASDALERGNKALDVIRDAGRLHKTVMIVSGLYFGLSISLIILSVGQIQAGYGVGIAGVIFLVVNILCALSILLFSEKIGKWRSFARSHTDDPNVTEAKSAARSVFILWCVLCAGWLGLGLIPVLILILKANHIL